MPETEAEAVRFKVQELTDWLIESLGEPPFEEYFVREREVHLWKVRVNDARPTADLAIPGKYFRRHTADNLIAHLSSEDVVPRLREIPEGTLVVHGTEGGTLRVREDDWRHGDDELAPPSL